MSSKHYMGPTHFNGARVEKTQKNDFAMKQTNICRLSGDIKMLKLITDIMFLKSSHIASLNYHTVKKINKENIKMRQINTHSVKKTEWMLN